MSEIQTCGVIGTFNMAYKLHRARVQLSIREKPLRVREYKEKEQIPHILSIPIRTGLYYT